MKQVGTFSICGWISKLTLMKTGARSLRISWGQGEQWGSFSEISKANMSPELDPVIDLSSDSEEEQAGSCANHKANSNLDPLKQREDQNVLADEAKASYAFVCFHLESLRFPTSPKLHLTQVNLELSVQNNHTSADLTTRMIWVKSWPMSGSGSGWSGSRSHEVSGIAQPSGILMWQSLTHHNQLRVGKELPGQLKIHLVFSQLAATSYLASTDDTNFFRPIAPTGEKYLTEPSPLSLCFTLR